MLHPLVQLPFSPEASLPLPRSWEYSSAEVSFNSFTSVLVNNSTESVLSSLGYRAGDHDMYVAVVLCADQVSLMG